MQLDADRSLVVRAVLQGQIAASNLTDNDVLDLELQTMELVFDEKLRQGYIVFSANNIVH